MNQTKSQLEGSHIEVQSLEEYKQKASTTEKDLRDELEKCRNSKVDDMRKVKGGEKVASEVANCNEKIKSLELLGKKKDETTATLKEMMLKYKKYSEQLLGQMEKEGLKAPKFDGSSDSSKAELEASIDSSAGGGGDGASIFELSQSSATSMSISSATNAKN